MSRPILYSFRRCPYAMRARLAIAVSGIQVELREILLKDKPQAMLNVSPKGTVPVLITADDQVIDESNDIMIWALQQSDPDHWLCTNPIEQELTTALITKNDHGFKLAADWRNCDGCFFAHLVHFKQPWRRLAASDRPWQ